MSEPAEPAEELYAERGASRLPLLWGPLFALAGFSFEWLSGDRAHTWTWVGAGVLLLLLTAMWVYARRRFLAVRLTRTELTLGGETVPVSGLQAIGEATPHTRDTAGARVLGGGLAVPKKHGELPVTLDDGTVVLAWARDAAALRAALEEVVTDSAPKRRGEQDSHEQ